jgi:1-acyl-sn-glycerol-3-phosphate acyltransferase
MTTLFLGLRASLFYFGYFVLIFWFSITGPLLFSFFPYRIRSQYILGWNRCTIIWARCTCGLRVNIVGKENLPNSPYVALAKHQSQWETYFLQYFLAPVSIVLKRELIRLPFFGWGLRLSDPIAIDRSSPKRALKMILEQGENRISRNISVLIFPEGTRINPGNVGKYARGGANIAISSNVPVVPIALNAGEFWPSNKFIKYPGTITVVIGKPIPTTDTNSRELTEQVKGWIEGQVAVLEKRT